MFKNLCKKLQKAEYLNFYQNTNDTGYQSQVTESLTQSRALIKYFSELGKMHDSKSTIDLKLIKGLLEKGADINFPDKHGQTVFMEVARGNILCLFVCYLVGGNTWGSVIIFAYELFANSCIIIWIELTCLLSCFPKH